MDKTELVDLVLARDSRFTKGARELLRSLAANQDKPSRTTASVRSRVARHRLKEQLTYYFNYTLDGRQQKERLSLRTQSADLILELNEFEISHVEHFWDVHCVGRPDRDRLRIIYTEPLFFFVPKEKNYVRCLDINCETSIVPADVLREARSHLKVDDLVPTFHYQPSGEIGARNLLLAWFRNYDVVKRQKMDVDSMASRHCVGDASIWSSNIILLGNYRTNYFIRELQENARQNARPRIAIGKHDVSVVGDPDSPRRDSATAAYAVVSRMPNVAGGVATWIAANDGRAAVKVADFLTKDEPLKRLYERFGLHRAEPLPESFQILFRVDVQKGNPVRAEVVASSFVTRSSGRSAGSSPEPPRTDARPPSTSRQPKRPKARIRR